MIIPHIATIALIVGALLVGFGLGIITQRKLPVTFSSEMFGLDNKGIIVLGPQYELRAVRKGEP